MSNPMIPTDYNQQLLAYLQVWRQLLEQTMALTPGVPMPTVPVMPTMPAAPAPSPPAPADYTQQLFGYLQAWRRYLEQTAGRPPTPPVPPVPPASAASAQPQPQSTAPTPPQPAAVNVVLAPSNPGGSQISDETAMTFGKRPQWIRPDDQWVSRDFRLSGARRRRDVSAPEPEPIRPNAVAAADARERQLLKPLVDDQSMNAPFTLPRGIELPTGDRAASKPSVFSAIAQRAAAKNLPDGELGPS